MNSKSMIWRRTGCVVVGLFVIGNGWETFGTSANAQEVTPPARPQLSIPLGRTVTVDGMFEVGEWEDADSTLINTWSAEPIVVRFKHDGSALLFAFSNFDDARPLVPEVLIAVDGSGETTWGSGRWWFHASGQDCWAEGHYNDWGTCIPVTPDWEANNPRREARSSGPLLWELRIPFSTIGLTLESETEVGIAFDVTDTQRFWFFWPPRAQLGVPATWADGVLEGGSVRGT